MRGDFKTWATWMSLGLAGFVIGAIYFHNWGFYHHPFYSGSTTDAEASEVETTPTPKDLGFCNDSVHVAYGNRIVQPHTPKSRNTYVYAYMGCGHTGPSSHAQGGCLPSCRCSPLCGCWKEE